MDARKDYSHAYTRQPAIDAFIVLFLGIMTGLILTLASSLEDKWFACITLGILCFSVLLIVPNREKLLLYASILLIPVGLDFYLMRLNVTSYPTPINVFRITAFDIVFYILLACWAIRLIVSRGNGFNLHPYITVPFFFLWILSLASSIQSPLPWLLKISNLYYLLMNGLFFLYLANNIRDLETAYIVVALFVAAAVIQSLLAIAQFSTNSSLGLKFFGAGEKSFFAMKAGAGIVGRVAGTFDHPNRLAFYLSNLLPWCIALFLAPVRFRLKPLILAALVIIGIAELLTFSRGGWLNAGVAVIITFTWCLAKRTKKKVLSILFVTAFLLLTFVIAVTFFKPVKQRLFEEDYGTAYTRVPLAKLALNMIRHNPLLGVGLGSFTAAAPKYDTTREAISHTFPAPVHNEFLLVASELGLPAFLLFLIILATIFIKLIRDLETTNSIKYWLKKHINED